MRAQERAKRIQQTMTEPVLYNFRRCPYAMRARMALHSSGIKVETREVVLRDKPQVMLDISPKGTVPVLVLDDGTVLEESLDIMRWALEQNDPEEWLKGTDTALIAANDGPFKHHLDRYKYSTRHDTDPDEHRSAAFAILQQLNARLEKSQFLCGDSRSFADIAIFPFIRQFANADKMWFDAQPIGNLQSWLAGLVESQLFADIMIKREQWKPVSE